jgi:hypothetical protein
MVTKMKKVSPVNAKPVKAAAKSASPAKASVLSGSV